MLENVLIGQHCHSRAGLAASIFQPPSQKAEEAGMRAKALEMLEFVGLKGKEFAQANSLPYGQQRLLELARALVSDPEAAPAGRAGRRAERRRDRGAGGAPVSDLRPGASRSCWSSMT